MARQQEVAAASACQLAEQMAQQQLAAKQALKQVRNNVACQLLVSLSNSHAVSECVVCQEATLDAHVHHT